METFGNAIEISYILAGGKDLSAKLAMVAMDTFVGITHSFWRALVLGGSFPDVTTYVIVVFNSIPNVISWM